MLNDEIRNSGPYYTYDWEQKPIFIQTAAGIGSFELPDKSILQKNKKVIGIGIPVSASGKKSDTGKALINTNAYNCAYLIIKSDTTTERFRLRFETCAYRSGGGDFFLRVPLHDIDIANSVVVFGDATTVVANEVVQIDFYYERC